jgi:iron(II)-dependent oxidoreductase
MAMVALIMLILVFLLPTEPGFTLLVQGAPAASDVYVDNIRRGMVAADGTITVHHLKAGKRLVSVAHEGCTEFNTAISGNDGENRAVLAQLTKIAAAQVTPQTLPPTIEYTGTMILIPAGEFIMGDDTHLANEKPAHKVTLPDYYIDKFEVTNAQYKKFCDETARTRPTNPWWDEQYFSRYPDAPIVGISWYDAAAYAKWAGKRLATEAEWEKAASWDVANNKKRIWPWGDNFLPDRTNTNSNHPTPINQFASGTSSYGVEDMAGNAAEWVDSIYQAYPGNTAYDKEFDSSYRVVRGGSFRSTADDVRTTRRFFHAPEFKADEKKDRSWLIGFRCVVSATDAKLQEFLRGRANQ